jgi:hypothetical protein
MILNNVLNTFSIVMNQLDSRSYSGKYTQETSHKIFHIKHREYIWMPLGLLNLVS